MRRIMFVAVLLVLSTGLTSFAGNAKAKAPQTAEADARLKHSFRRPDNNGWIFVHLEGSPSEIGFQHGYLLAPENRGCAESHHPRTDAPEWKGLAILP